MWVIFLILGLAVIWYGFMYATHRVELWHKSRSQKAIPRPLECPHRVLEPVESLLGEVVGYICVDCLELAEYA